MILSPEDFFFMRVGARFYYARVLRIVEDGALCQVLNGDFRVLVPRDNKHGRGIKMPHTGEVGEIEMVRSPRSFPFRSLDYAAALDWYVNKGRKNSVTV